MIGGINILTCKLGNEIINCYDGTHNKEQLKKWASKKILLCPACGKPYEYCHGRVKTPYFRHMEKTECEDKYSESETQEHLNGKRDLYEWIKQQPGVYDAILEGWIPETKQRPDIMFKYKDKQYVIEYQCSPIASEYIERHELYNAIEITDIWICGTDKYLQKNMRDKYLESVSCGYYNYTVSKFIFPYECDLHQLLDSITLDDENNFGFSSNHYKPTQKTPGTKLFDNLLQNLTFEGVICYPKLPSIHSVNSKRKARSILKESIHKERGEKHELLLKHICNSISNSHFKYYCNHDGTIHCTIHYQNYIYNSTLLHRFFGKKGLYVDLDYFIKQNKNKHTNFTLESKSIHKQLYEICFKLKDNDILIIKDSKKQAAFTNGIRFKNISVMYSQWYYDDINFNELPHLESDFELIKGLNSALRFLEKHNFNLCIGLPYFYVPIYTNAGIFNFKYYDDIIQYFTNVLGFNKIKIYD